MVSLSGSADSPATVRVYAVPQWDASTTIPWLTVTNKTADSLDIVANGSNEVEIRTGSVIIKAGERTITVKQVPQDHLFLRFHLRKLFQSGTVMSDSGKWAGGIWWRDGAAGERECVVNVIDLETDEWHELASFTRPLFTLMQPGAIADDGTIYIYISVDANVAVNLDGEYWMVDAIPSGFTREMQIARIAADGTMVGRSGKGVCSYPWKMVDGVTIELPKPKKNFRDEPIADVQARGSSANGKIIYGTTRNNEDYGMV